MRQFLVFLRGIHGLGGYYERERDLVGRARSRISEPNQGYITSNPLKIFGLSGRTSSDLCESRVLQEVSPTEVYTSRPDGQTKADFDARRARDDSHPSHPMRFRVLGFRVSGFRVWDLGLGLSLEP